MVINEKALVKEMKEAYKGWGYTVMVLPGGEWVFMTKAWAAEIDAQTNVPNEALSLIVLHMEYLPERETAYRIYKDESGPVIQQEVFSVAEATYTALCEQRRETDAKPLYCWQTKLRLGACRVWQRPSDLEILLIDPTYERIIESKKNIRVVGDAIYAEGQISCVYVMRVQNAGEQAHIEHLSQMQWIE